MQKIDFVNATHPAINDTNLNLMQDNIETAINAQVSGDTLPLGALLPFPGGTIPENYLLCDGSAVSRTTYALLFNVIGTTYGPGDGSTTFNLPDMRSRTLVGVDTRDSDLNAVGKTYGEKTHTLTQNQLPANMIDTANTGSNTDGYIARAGYTKTGSYNFGGAGQPFNIMQPSMATNYIIKAFQTAGVVAQVVTEHSESTTNVYSASYVNGISDYSTTEKICGTWIDGKPIYRKVIYIASLPNSASVLYSAGITNVDIVTKLYGVSRGQTGHNFPLPYVGVFSTNSSIELTYMNGGDIRIVTQNDRSSNSAYIIIEYTKTTD